LDSKNQAEYGTKNKEGKMKTKIFGILGIVLILAMAAACGTAVEANQDRSINVPLDDFANNNNIAKQIEIEKGGVLAVILGSNPSTGYSWTENAVIGDGAVLAQAVHDFGTPDQTGEPVVGAPVTEYWTFNTIEAGTTTITMQYARPWETGAAAYTFVLTVVVK
jgi:inhibitor of cysteine peptidase